MNTGIPVESIYRFHKSGDLQNGQPTAVFCQPNNSAETMFCFMVFAYGPAGSRYVLTSSLPGRSRPNPMCRRVWPFFKYLYHMLFPIPSLVSARCSTVRGLSLSLGMFCDATCVSSWCLRNPASTRGMAGVDLLIATMPLCFSNWCLQNRAST